MLHVKFPYDFSHKCVNILSWYDQGKGEECFGVIGRMLTVLNLCKYQKLDLFSANVKKELRKLSSIQPLVTLLGPDGEFEIIN